MTCFLNTARIIVLCGDKLMRIVTFKLAREIGSIMEGGGKYVKKINVLMAIEQHPLVH